MEMRWNGGNDHSQPPYGRLIAWKRNSAPCNSTCIATYNIRMAS